LKFFVYFSVIFASNLEMEEVREGSGAARAAIALALGANNGGGVFSRTLSHSPTKLDSVTRELQLQR